MTRVIRWATILSVAAAAMLMAQLGAGALPGLTAASCGAGDGIACEYTERCNLYDNEGNCMDLEQTWKYYEDAPE